MCTTESDGTYSELKLRKLIDEVRMSILVVCVWRGKGVGSHDTHIFGISDLVFAVQSRTGVPIQELLNLYN